MYFNNTYRCHRVCLVETNRTIYIYICVCVYIRWPRKVNFIFDLRPRSKGHQLGHVAYHLMRLDNWDILKPTLGLYRIPIKSYKQKRMYIDLIMALFDLKWPFRRSDEWNTTAVFHRAHITSACTKKGQSFHTSWVIDRSGIYCWSTDISLDTYIVKLQSPNVKIF